MSPIRVMTFNIRNSGAADGTNRWPLRRSLWIDTVRSFGPDLLGVQEVLQDQYDDLTAAFDDHAGSGVGRDDGRGGGERAMILFRTSRFELLDAGTFWLSETPDKVASTSWDTCLTRSCSWVRLLDREVRRGLIFANTHFDHVGETARLESAKLLAEKLPRLAGARPVILTGDFNCTEADPPHAALTRGGMTDSYRAVHPAVSPDESSFHGFAGTTAGKRIDWIFHTPDLTATAATIDRTRGPDGRCPSDHDAVTATLRWR
jgi:endonuclease/exonuclease/phosphatase family metal-dependent hydrolase